MSLAPFQNMPTDLQRETASFIPKFDPLDYAIDDFMKLVHVTFMGIQEFLGNSCIVNAGFDVFFQDEKKQDLDIIFPEDKEYRLAVSTNKFYLRLSEITKTILQTSNVVTIFLDLNLFDRSVQDFPSNKFNLYIDDRFLANREKVTLNSKMSFDYNGVKLLRVQVTAKFLLDTIHDEQNNFHWFPDSDNEEEEDEEEHEHNHEQEENW
jgi:hypothetical protein